MRELLKENYGHYFEDELINEIIEIAHLKEIKQGDVLMDYGQQIKYMPLLIEGAIKILRQDKDGDELLLYFLEKGDTCSMTLTCCAGDAKSEIRAVTEQNCTLFLIPVYKMGEWTQKYSGWMQFVFESFQNRTNEMLEAIDNLAFKNMHDRLHQYIKERVLVTKSIEIEITHQEIANDLHTSRVVISRLLKSLEKDGKIKLFRNKLEIIDC